MTPFQYASNTPIQAIDLDGLEAYYISSGGITDEELTNQLSSIIGYKVSLSDKETEIALPEGSKTVKGREIIIGDKIGEGVEGFGAELRKLLRKTDVQIGIQFQELPNDTLVNDWQYRNDEPLTFDKSILENKTSEEFVAHLFTHEIAETISLAENGGDVSDYKIGYVNRNHREASKVDLKAAKNAMGVGHLILIICPVRKY